MLRGHVTNERLSEFGYSGCRNMGRCMSMLWPRYSQQAVTTLKPASSVLRTRWVHLGLFVFAYCGFLWYLHVPAPAEVLMSIGEQAATQSRDRNGSAGIRNNGRAGGGVASLASAAKNGSGIETVAGEVSQAEENEPRATPVQANEWISQASAAQDVAERTAAIANLAKYASDRDVLQAMSIVLETEVSSRNRALAVGALANLATRQKDNSLALSLLQRSTADADPRVAARARAAYNKIVGTIDEVEQSVTE